MPYQITTTSSFVIDGSELNAGDRAFARDQRTFVIDGVEAGTAGLRQYLKDHRVYAITGMGGQNQDRPGVMITASYAITGRPRNERIFADPVNFEITGTPGNYDIVATRYASVFVIDTVTQETPP